VILDCILDRENKRTIKDIIGTTGEMQNKIYRIDTVTLIL